jgi:hypothetical protein
MESEPTFLSSDGYGFRTKLGLDWGFALSRGPLCKSGVNASWRFGCRDSKRMRLARGVFPGILTARSELWSTPSCTRHRPTPPTGAHARGVDSPHPLGPVETSVCSVAALENPRRRRAALITLGVSPQVASKTAGSGPRPLAYRPVQSPLWGFPMLTSNRWVFRRWSRRASLTKRTAVEGPVRTVVYQGSGGNRCPCADQHMISERRKRVVAAQ